MNFDEEETRNLNGCNGETWHKAMITAAGRQNCAVNGPEWADSDEIDSEDHIDISQGSGRIREK